MARKSARRRRTARAPRAPRRRSRSGGGGMFRRTTSSLKQTFAKANPLQMALFAGGGYFLGQVLESTGLPQWLYNTFPAYQQYANATNMGGPVGNRFGATSIVKTGGVALFLKTLYESRKGSISAGSLNTQLPFALGAMFDGPENTGNGITGSINPSTRW
jgi:hypothetical protein